MGQFLSAAVALAILLAAASPRADGKVPFSVTTRNLVFTEKVASVTVLPGADLDLQIAGSDGPYRVEAKTGRVEAKVGILTARHPITWRWRAPTAPGPATLTVEDARGRKVLDLHAFVMVPFGEVRDGRLNGYRIGSYPPKTQPLGFVEVTPETILTKLSPHFELRQFLCKQPGGFPKYVVISEALILKLERIIEALDRAGHDVDTLTVMSGYRTPFYNEGIGNVRDSQHTAGTAADVFVDQKTDGRMDDLDRDGMVTRDDAIWLFRLIDGMDRMPAAFFKGGLGEYGSTAAHGPFVHVDVRGRLARWRG
ncbi:MAG: D-Ala-D-Ala carboxypeptidase family metallohydrolase [Vicinamibacteraceae bacterium]